MSGNSAHDALRNLYLMENLNGALWFLPALFLSMLLFRWLDRAGPRWRNWLAAGLLALSASCFYLPILLPWSLDTVGVTAVMVCLGKGLRAYEPQLEGFSLSELKQKRTAAAVCVLGFSYLLLVYMSGTLDTAKRNWGNLGAAGILTYLALGLLGTVIYLLLFSALEKERWGRPLVRGFAYLGARTIPLLATHLMVYKLLNLAAGELLEGAGTLGKVGLRAGEIVLALAMGLLLEVFVSRAGEKVSLLKYL